MASFKFCPSCGGETGGTKFCVECGSDLRQEAYAPAAAAPKNKGKRSDEGQAAEPASIPPPVPEGVPEGKSEAKKSISDISPIRVAPVAEGAGGADAGGTAEVGRWTRKRKLAGGCVAGVIVIAIGVVAVVIWSGSDKPLSGADRAAQGSAIERSASSASTTAPPTPAVQEPTAEEFYQCISASAKDAGLEIVERQPPAMNGREFMVVANGSAILGNEILWFAQDASVVTRWLNSSAVIDNEAEIPLRGLSENGLIVWHNAGMGDASRPIMDGFSDAQQRVYFDCYRGSPVPGGSDPTDSGTVTQRSDGGLSCGSVTGGSQGSYYVTVPAPVAQAIPALDCGYAEEVVTKMFTELDGAVGGSVVITMPPFEGISPDEVSWKCSTDSGDCVAGKNGGIMFSQETE
jgi:hypothetical protein